jgi:hypothetical protein
MRNPSSPWSCALGGAIALLVGCAETQNNRAVATVLRGPKPDVMNQVAAALLKGGHKCMLDEDVDLTCDAEKPTSVNISYRTGPGGLHLRFMSGFKWKKPDPCTELGPRMNQFNDRADTFHGVCTPIGLIVVSSIVVPENGLSDKDINAYLKWWIATADSAMRSPVLAGYL